MSGPLRGRLAGMARHGYVVDSGMLACMTLRTGLDALVGVSAAAVLSIRLLGFKAMPRISAGERGKPERPR